MSTDAIAKARPVEIDFYFFHLKLEVSLFIYPTDWWSPAKNDQPTRLPGGGRYGIKVDKKQLCMSAHMCHVCSLFVHVCLVSTMLFHKLTPSAFFLCCRFWPPSLLSPAGRCQITGDVLAGGFEFCNAKFYWSQAESNKIKCPQTSLQNTPCSKSVFNWNWSIPVYLSYWWSPAKTTSPPDLPGAAGMASKLAKKGCAWVHIRVFLFIVYSCLLGLNFVFFTDWPPSARWNPADINRAGLSCQNSWLALDLRPPFMWTLD